MKYLLEYQTKNGWTKTYYKTFEQVKRSIDNKNSNGEKFINYRLWELKQKEGDNNGISRITRKI